MHLRVSAMLAMAGLNGSKVLQCADVDAVVLGILQLPVASSLADVCMLLTDKTAPWR